MKTVFIVKKLTKAVIALIILLYFTFNTISPKIIFTPFLLCDTMSIGKYTGLLIDNKNLSYFFDSAFKIVFFLSWFAFLIVACWMGVNDGNYKIIVFTLPFWIGGLFFVKRKLLGKKHNREENNNENA